MKPDEVERLLWVAAPYSDGLIRELAVALRALTAAQVEPVAWTTMLNMGRGGSGPIFTTNPDVAQRWREAGEVTPLYVAPKSAPEGPALAEDAAKLCEAVAAKYEARIMDEWRTGYVRACNDCADAIRRLASSPPTEKKEGES